MRNARSGGRIETGNRALERRRDAVPARRWSSADDDRRGLRPADDAGDLDVWVVRGAQIAVLDAGAHPVAEPDSGRRGETDDVAIALVAVVRGAEGRPVGDVLLTALRCEVHVAGDLS